MIDAFDLPIRQRHVAAGDTTMTKPPGAASSVFDVGQQLKPKRAKPVLPDVNVPIRKGVPLPAATVGRKSDTYGEILSRMEDGDMVELTESQATCMRARAKKAGIEMAVRALASQGPKS